MSGLQIKFLWQMDWNLLHIVGCQTQIQRRHLPCVLVMCPCFNQRNFYWLRWINCAQCECECVNKSITNQTWRFSLSLSFSPSKPPPGSRSRKVLHHLRPRIPHIPAGSLSLSGHLGGHVHCTQFYLLWCIQCLEIYHPTTRLRNSSSS